MLWDSTRDSLLPLTIPQNGQNESKCMWLAESGRSYVVLPAVIYEDLIKPDTSMYDHTPALPNNLDDVICYIFPDKFNNSPAFATKLLSQECCRLKEKKGQIYVRLLNILAL